MRMMASLFARSVLGDAKEPELIGEFLGVAAGIFVEVGANDPVLLSQTYRLEQLGWNGILIEPLRECADKLRAARRARIYEVAAGAPEDEGRELPLLVAGALSTLQASTVEDSRSSEIRQVPVRTLDFFARGYKLVRRTALNNWYVPIGTPFPISPFGRWQLFRKLYLGTWLRRWKRRRKLRRRASAVGQTPAEASRPK